MARTEKRLSARAVDAIKELGLHGDGAGIYLKVTPGGTKSWILRYMLAGRARSMGLGAYPLFGLADARDAVHHLRKLVKQGTDPIEARLAERTTARLDAARTLSFEKCAEAYIEAHRPTWKNEKHAAQWPATLKSYAYPVFGSLPVQMVDTALVSKVLEPIWRNKTETASRLRGRIEAILDWATVRGFRQGLNPARWRGHLDTLLPERGKLRKVAHHPALPYTEISAFVTDLRAQEGVSARALEFLILTAGRTSEIIGARWDEIDLAQKIWTVPAERMKAGREHRVPLSPAAVTLIEAMARVRHSEFVFPGVRPKKPLSNMALLQLLKRMKRGDLTSHGFRSTFRDWAAERTSFPREVAEMALAHTLSDKVEAAYRRGDLFQKRSKLMEAWATFCGQRNFAADVISIGAKANG